MTVVWSLLLGVQTFGVYAWWANYAAGRTSVWPIFPIAAAWAAFMVLALEGT